MQDLTTYNEAQLAEWYINNREWLRQRKAAYEAEIESVETTQTEIETELQKRLNAAGATSLRTQSGTVVQSTRTTFSAEDPNAFGQYIVANGCYEATSIRPVKEFVEDYMRNHDGQLPPGVAARSQHVISIKKPTK